TQLGHLGRAEFSFGRRPDRLHRFSGDRSELSEAAEAVAASIASAPDPPVMGLVPDTFSVETTLPTWYNGDLPRHGPRPRRDASPVSSEHAPAFLSYSSDGMI